MVLAPIPTAARIHSPSLVIATWIWKLSVLGYFVFKLLAEQAHMTNVDMLSTSAMDVRVVFNESLARQSEATYMAMPACTNVEYYPVEETGTEITCPRPCYDGPQNSSCLTTGDLYSRSSGALYIKTLIRRSDKVNGVDSGASIIVNAYVDALEVRLAYAWAIAPQIRESRDAFINTVPHRRQLDSRTIVYKRIGTSSMYEPVRVEPPAKELAFTLKELVAFAGQERALDDPNPFSMLLEFRSGNDIVRRPPPGRLYGLEMEIHVDCQEELPYMIKWANGITKNMGECHMFVKLRQSGINCEHTRKFYNVSSSRFETSCGVFFFFDTLSSYKVISRSKVLQVITASYVLLSLAAMVVWMFTTTCLGATSRVYNNVCREHLSVQKQVAVLCMRMLGNHNIFSTLESDGVIHKDTLIDTMWPFLDRALEMKHEDKSSKDAQNKRAALEAFIHFSFRAAQTPEANMKFSEERGMLSRILRFRKSTLPGDADKVRKLQFFNMICDKERIDFFDLQKLLLKERPLGFFESVFRPSWLQKLTEDYAPGEVPIGLVRKDAVPACLDAAKSQQSLSPDEVQDEEEHDSDMDGESGLTMAERILKQPLDRPDQRTKAVFLHHRNIGDLLRREMDRDRQVESLYKVSYAMLTVFIEVHTSLVRNLVENAGKVSYQVKTLEQAQAKVVEAAAKLKEIDAKETEKEKEKQE